MILQWRDSDFSRQEKLLGVIFDAGMILRQDLLELLGWPRQTLDRYLKKCRNMQGDMLRRYFTSEGTCVYSLGEAGIRYVHQMLGIQSRAVTMEGQLSHTLGLNAVLMRLLQVVDTVELRWYSTREATDELFRLRQSETGELEANLRSSIIRPDALLTVAGRLSWIEYDNNTETSRQLVKKYRLFHKNLQPLHDSFRLVTWITKNEKRREMMQRLWENESLVGVKMIFYVEGEEVQALTGEG